MQIGQGSHKRSSWRCWAWMALVVAVALPGARSAFAAGEEPESLRPLRRVTGALRALVPVEEKRPIMAIRPTNDEPKAQVDTGFLVLPEGTTPEDLVKPLATLNSPGVQQSSRVIRAYAVADLVLATQEEHGVSEKNAQAMVQQTAVAAGYQPSPVAGLPKGFVWSGDQLVVQATPEEHKKIVETLEAMRTHGLKYIQIKTRWITGPADKLRDVNVAWNAAHGDLWTGGSEDPLAGFSEFDAESETLVADGSLGRARTIRGKNVPARFAVLDEEQVETLLGQLEAENDEEAEPTGVMRRWVRRVLGTDEVESPGSQVAVSDAPRVSLFNGQRANIQDCSQRPFVVSLKRVTGPAGSAHQPIIRVIDEGMQLGLRSEIQEEGTVRLDCEVTLTYVVDVDVYTFEGEVSVQIPEVETTRLDAAAVLPIGHTLLIGGLKMRDREGNLQPVLLMLSPTDVSTVSETS